MKTKIPKFKSLEEERKFWDTHSITEFMNEFTPAKITFTKPKRKLVSIRLDTEQIESLRQVASHKGIGYLSLIRYWISERIAKEDKTPRPSHN